MHIHYFQHVSFEDPAYIATWAEKRRILLTGTHLYRPFSLPAIESIDALIVMGGPMGVHDESHYPWIRQEKQFIESAIDSDKKVIGICLGAQMIADVLGARVYKNKDREIGWFPVYFTKEQSFFPLIRDLPPTLMAFHWHGDTFDLPRNASHIGWSDACRNQAFTINHQIVGLQFHLEGTRESILRLVGHCSGDLQPGRFVQSSDEIDRSTQLLEQSSWKYCDLMMDQWSGIQEGNYEEA